MALKFRFRKHATTPRDLQRPIVEEETPKPVVETPVAHRQRTFSYDKYLVPAMFVVLLVVLVAVGYTQLRGETTTTEAAPLDQREISKLVDKVGKHILLPSGEQATIATVTDVTKLEKNDFFSLAQNGDKVLIYANAKIAILYRPSLDKVVTVGPVSQENSTVSITPPPSSGPTPTEAAPQATSSAE